MNLLSLLKHSKKNLVFRQLCQQHAAPAAAAPEAGAKKKKKSPNIKLNLIEGGPDKIKTIKALRQVTTLGLTEAKNAVEETPTVIAEAASKEDAKK